MHLQIQAIAYAGAFGGARQGVQEAEYMAGSDRNRAALQAQLLQQGFGQANELAQNQFGNQTISFRFSCITRFHGPRCRSITTLGGALQAQRQNELTAQQQLAQQQLNQPIQAAQAYGSGVTQFNCRISRSNYNKHYTYHLVVYNSIRCWINTSWYLQNSYPRIIQ